MKTICICLLLIFTGLIIYGQENIMELGLSIDEQGYGTHSTAILDVKSTSKGVLVPRLTFAQYDAIVNPATGLLLYDQTNDVFVFYNGSAWISLDGGGNGTDDQTLSFSGTTLTIEDGNNVNLSALQDGTGTDDQTLSFIGTTLTIEDGNNVNLSALQDGTGTDDQTLSLTGTTLSIEGGNNVNIRQDELKDVDGNTKIQVEEGNDDDQIRFDIDGFEKLVIKENANGELMIDLNANSNNTIIGKDAGLNVDYSFPDGISNTYYGAFTGKANSSGSYNSCFGRSSGEDNESGDWNTLIGAFSGQNLSSGSSNTMIGYATGNAQTSGLRNTYIGDQAGALRTGGSNNTFIGHNAGRNTASGSNNVFIGYFAGSQSSSSDELYIDNSSTTKPLIYGDFSNNRLQCNGDLYVNENAATNANAQFYFKVNDVNKFSMAYETANDYFVIKDEVNNDRVLYIKDGKVGVQRSSPTNNFEVNGTASKSTAGEWLANSDARLKKNIKPLSSISVLQKLLQLQGLTFEWNDDKTGNNRPEGIQYGFTAQNIQEVFPELVSEDNLGYLQTAYGTYDAMYVEAIRALLTKITELELRIEQLEK